MVTSALHQEEVVAKSGDLVAIGRPAQNEVQVFRRRKSEEGGLTLLETINPTDQNTRGFGSEVSLVYASEGWWVTIYSLTGEALSKRVEE
ncbi:MAG: hypothetical protein OXB96_00290 [Candidatus Kaiserbacteria bacterium]|nr:hypothetical protein [Candidatus Kaiserbacteria bacterium]